MFSFIECYLYILSSWLGIWLTVGCCNVFYFIPSSLALVETSLFNHRIQLLKSCFSKSYHMVLCQNHCQIFFLIEKTFLARNSGWIVWDGYVSWVIGVAGMEHLNSLNKYNCVIWHGFCRNSNFCNLVGWERLGRTQKLALSHPYLGNRRVQCLKYMLITSIRSI